MTTRAQTTTVLRMGGWTAYLSGAVAAIGLLFWFARFAFPGSVIGWLNDVFVMIQYALTVPITVSLHSLLRSYNPGRSLSAMVVGIEGMVAVVVLQFLLLVDALTFAQQVRPVTTAILVIGLWLVITGCLARSTGKLPHSLRMSIIAAHISAIRSGHSGWADAFSNRVGSRSRARPPKQSDISRPADD